MSPNSTPASAREQLIAMLYGEMLTQQERMESMQSRIEESVQKLEKIKEAGKSTLLTFNVIAFLAGAAVATSITYL